MLPLPADYYAPDPPAIRPAERVSAIIEILICSGLPTQVLLITALRGFGMQMEQAGGGVNPTFLFTVALLDAAAVIGLVIVMLRVHGESPRDVLLGRVRLLREAVVGISMIPLAFALVIVILGLVLTYAPQLHNVARNPLEDMLRNRTDTMIFAVVVMVAGGVREEIQRGFILHRFGQYLGGGDVRRPDLQLALRPRALRAGLRRVHRHGRAGRVLGARLSAPRKHRGADGEPRRLQPAADPEARAAEVTCLIALPDRLSRFFLLTRRELTVLALLFVVSLPGSHGAAVFV